MKERWLTVILILCSFFLTSTSCSNSPVAPKAVSIGSGFWIDQNGYVATCWHVVKNHQTSAIVVKSAIDPLFDLQKNNLIFANWEVYPATVVAKDESNDLAILKVSGNPFTNRNFVPIKIDGKELIAHYTQSDINTALPESGQRILLAGYPLGLPYPVVQEGNIASVAGDNNVVKILISTVINPGNSGGPVFDTNGQVIGVINAMLSSSFGQSGIAEAIPSHYLDDLMKGVVDISPSEKTVSPSQNLIQTDLVQLTKTIKGNIVQIEVTHN